MMHLNEKEGSRDKTHNLLTIDITEIKSGTLQKQGGSQYLTPIPCGIDEAPVDDPEYLNLHHESMQDK